MPVSGVPIGGTAAGTSMRGIGPSNSMAGISPAPAPLFSPSGLPPAPVAPSSLPFTINPGQLELLEVVEGPAAAAPASLDTAAYRAKADTATKTCLGAIWTQQVAESNRLAVAISDPPAAAPVAVSDYTDPLAAAVFAAASRDKKRRLQPAAVGGLQGAVAGFQGEGSVDMVRKLATVKKACKATNATTTVEMADKLTSMPALMLSVIASCKPAAAPATATADATTTTGMCGMVVGWGGDLCVPQVLTWTAQWQCRWCRWT